jgi:drug/metabolite transporter (DMT)-like permease
MTVAKHAAQDAPGSLVSRCVRSLTSAARSLRALSGATMTGVGAILLWSALAVLTAASGDAPPFELAALTFAIGGLGGLLYAALRRRLAALIQPWPVWLVGVGGLFGYHALYFAALKRAPPAEASLINYLWPLLIVVLSALQPGERLSLRHVAGAALGLAGVAALFSSKADGTFLSTASLSGDALALCCAFVWATYSVASRRLRQAPTEAVAGFCLVTALLAAVCHFVFEVTVVPSSLVQWGAIVGLGVGPVGLAFYVWDYGVKHGDIRLLGVAAYAAPVLSTLILVAAGFAPATASLAVASALIVAGAAVASMRSGG